MIDFTGHSCANCRKMESEVLSKPEVSKALHDNFVVASLYVDEKRELPEVKNIFQNLISHRLIMLEQKPRL